ncbi:MAG: TetR/AcrR family transcriptional regulator, partial [Stackebrandtia sp.]
VRDGRLPPQDPRTGAAALVGAIGEVLVGPLAERVHGESVVPELVAFALRALGATHDGPVAGVGAPLGAAPANTPTDPGAYA